MLEVAWRLAECHKCTGIKPCPVDGVDIQVHAHAGDCPKKRFDGEAFVQVGLPTKGALTAADILNGAKGIAKAIAGTGGADAALVEERTNICNGCENAILSLGVLSRCKLCGCSTWAKVRNAAEHCPAGKW